MTACSRCGYESSQELRFCPGCGADAGAASRELRLLADLDRAEGRSDAATAHVASAIDLDERKGDVVSAARAWERA